MTEPAAQWKPELVRIAAFSSGRREAIRLGSGLVLSCPLPRRCSASPPRWVFQRRPLLRRSSSPMGRPGRRRRSGGCVTSLHWPRCLFAAMPPLPLGWRWAAGLAPVSMGCSSIRPPFRYRAGWMGKGSGRRRCNRPHQQQASPCRTGERRAGAVWLYPGRSGSPHSAGPYPWRRRSSGAGPQQPHGLAAMHYEMAEGAP